MKAYIQSLLLLVAVMTGVNAIDPNPQVNSGFEVHLEQKNFQTLGNLLNTHFSDIWNNHLVPIVPAEIRKGGVNITNLHVSNISINEQMFYGEINPRHHGFEGDLIDIHSL
jgi:hypothetical protein